MRVHAFVQRLMHDFPLKLSRNATKTVGTKDHRNTTKYEILCRKRKTKDFQKTKNEDQNIFTWLTLWRCREGRCVSGGWEVGVGGDCCQSFASLLINGPFHRVRHRGAHPISLPSVTAHFTRIPRGARQTGVRPWVPLPV